MSQKDSDLPPVKLTRNCEVRWDKETKEGRELIENHIEKWLLQLKSGDLACPNISCVGKFYHPYQFICHLKSCTSLEGMQNRALLRGTLPCIICSHEILIEKYHHHFRSSHKDINENLQILESSKTALCLNYKCSMKFKEPFTYLEHCIHCKPLFMCEECHHGYHTKVGLLKHQCSSFQNSKKDKDITIDDEKKDPPDNDSDRITNEKAKNKINDNARYEKEILSGKERKKRNSNVWVRRSSRGFKDFELFENDAIVDLNVTGIMENLFQPKEEQVLEQGFKIIHESDLEKACKSVTYLHIEKQEKAENSNDQGECVHSPTTEESPCVQPFSDSNAPEKVPKKRGRPKKISVSEAVVKDHTESTLTPGESVPSSDTGRSPSLSFETQQPHSDSTVLQKIPKKRGRPKKISISEAVIKDHTESTLTPGESVPSSDTGRSPSLSFETQQPHSDSTVLQKIPKKRGRPKKISISEPVIKDHTESTLTPGESVPSSDTGRSPSLSFETQQPHSDSTVLQKIPKKRGRPKKISISEPVIKDHTESTLTPGESVPSSDTGRSPSLSFETQQPHSDSTVLQKIPKKRGRPKKISISEPVIKDHTESTLTPGESVPSSDTGRSPSLSFETQQPHSDSTVLQKIPKKRGRPKKISISEPVIKDHTESTLTPGESVPSSDTGRSPSLSFETQQPHSDSTVLQKIPKKRGRPKKISISEPVIKDHTESTLTPGESVPSSDTGRSPSLSFETQQPHSDSTVLQKIPKKRGRPKKISISEPVIKDHTESTLTPGESVPSSDTGRSPSLSFETQQPHSDSTVLQKIPKKRGRPKKISISEPVIKDHTESTLTPGESVPSSDTGRSPSLSFETQQLHSDSTVLQKIPKKRGRPKKISISEPVIKDHTESTLTPGESVPSSDTGRSPSLSFETQQPHSDSTVLQKIPKKRGRPKKISISEPVIKDHTESTLTPGESVPSSDTGRSPSLSFETQQPHSDRTVLQKIPKRRGRPKGVSTSEAVIQGHAESTVTPGEYVPSLDARGSPSLSFGTQGPFSDSNALQKIPKKRGRPKKISSSEAVIKDHTESTLTQGESAPCPDTGGSPSLSFETQQPHSDSTVLQKVPKKSEGPNKISTSEAVIQNYTESALAPGKCSHSSNIGGKPYLFSEKQHPFSDRNALQKLPKKRGRPRKISFSEQILPDPIHVSQNLLQPHATGTKQSASFQSNLSSFDSQILKPMPKKRGRPKMFPRIIAQGHGANDETGFLNPFEISSASVHSDLSFDTNDIGLKEGQKKGRPRKDSSSEPPLKCAKKDKAMNTFQNDDLSVDSELYESSLISNSGPDDIEVTKEREISKGVWYSEPNMKALPSQNEDQPCSNAIPATTTIVTTTTATRDGFVKSPKSTCATPYLTNGYSEKVRKKRGRPKKISLPEASLLDKLKNMNDNDSQEEEQKVLDVKRKKSYKRALENMKITISRNSEERLVLMKQVSKNSSKILKIELTDRDVLQSSANESVQMDSHCDANDVMEQKSTANDKATQQINRKKESKRKIDSFQMSMVLESDVQEAIAKWTDLFQSGIFQCPVQNCGKEFRTHMSLLKHIKQCDANDPVICVIRSRMTLPCHVCQERFPVFPDFPNHARVYHSNLNFLLKILESNSKPKCLNHHCDKELNNFNECLEHTTNCGCLLKCDICKRDYKTRIYFAKHVCLEEKSEKEIEKPAKNEELVVLSGVRQSAKRALNAIQTSDSMNDDDYDSVASIKRANSDDDFDGDSMMTCDVAEDQEEFEEDDPTEDEADESDSNSVTESEAVHHENRSDKKRTTKKEKDAVRGISHAFTVKSKARTPKCISNMNIKPNNPNINFLKNLMATNHTSRLFPQWSCSIESMQFITESDAEKYFPGSSVSPLFDIVHENQSGRIVKANEIQLDRFQTMPPLEGSRTSTFFVGGPIESLEWCPTQGKETQYIAVTTRSSYGQISNCMLKETHNSLLQIWTIHKANKQSVHYQGHMSLGIVFDSFQVSCMQWCPSGSSYQNNEADSIRRLGILACGCSDALIRVFSIPHPEDCISKLNQNDNHGDDQMRNRTFTKFDPVLILSASGCQSFVRCLDWQPMRGHKKIAAGFQDGSVCIWDLETKSRLLRQKSTDIKCDVLQPIKKISAHCNCVTSVMWCVNDANFLLTGSHDKSMKTFDVRERNSIPVVTVKRALFEGCSFEISMTGITCIEDEAFSCIPAGSRFVDLILNTFDDAAYSLTDLITAHNGGCKGFSSSQWINGLATSCSAGEVVFRAYETVFHPSYKSIRVPVYHIETSNSSREMTDDLKKSSETQQNNEQSSNQQTQSKDITDESEIDHGKSGNQRMESLDFPAIEIIRKRANELATEVFKMKFTFKDCNFFENRKKLLKSTKEADRVRLSGSMQESNIEKHEMRLITQLKWNPNYGNHHMLASGGFLGFVRIHHFTQWR